MRPDLSNTQKNRMFAPITFGDVTARNRMVMAPMVTNFATPENEITDRQITYYAERASGGVGTIVVEASVVHQRARAFERQVGVYDDRLLPGLSRLADAIRANGAVAIMQLHHAGPKINPAIGFEPVSVSPVMIREGAAARQLSLDELQQVRRDFGAAARRARKAGFNGVELHAAHFYMLSASISPYTNRRDDEYGGSVSNRAKLTREIIKDIKDEHGSDLALSVRMNGFEALDPGLTTAESQQVATIFAGAGADVIHVSAVAAPTGPSVNTDMRIPPSGGLSKQAPPGPFLEYAGAVKKVVRIPVVAVGKLDDPALAAKALSDGTCDMVALGRQLLCDPHWVKKVQQGQEKEIVHCIYCQTCHKALHKNKDIYCAQNRNLYGKPSYRKQSTDEAMTKTDE